MANPRQRRKAKSGTYKPVSHSKRAKRLLKKMPAIRGPKVLQDAWDPTKTVHQNYQALGLQHDLNPISSGGSEINVRYATDPVNACQPDTPTSASAIDGEQHSVSKSITPILPKGFGRIIRDSSGNVVCVELPSDEEVGLGSKQDLGIDTPVVTTESELQIWANDRLEIRQGSGGMKDTIVQDLEKLVASASIRERYTSSGQRLYLERLVNKYGEDLEKMARDRRLNPEQRTANELKRAIAKAGGFGACTSTATEVAG